MLSNKDHLYVALYACGGNPIMPGKEDMKIDHAELNPGYVIII